MTNSILSKIIGAFNKGTVTATRANTIEEEVAKMRKMMAQMQETLVLGGVVIRAEIKKGFDFETDPGPLSIQQSLLLDAPQLHRRLENGQHRTLPEQY